MTGIKNVDLVYLWVDGSDPEWLKKRSRISGIPFDNTEANSKARFTNNDELKYSLRSVENHIPWIRKIFIVTDHQIPTWLNTSHPKIQMIDQEQILPKEANPCFNSNIIEYFLYKIDGLSDHFIYANDDMFFNKDVPPDFFFRNDGYPIVRLRRKPLGKWHHKIKYLSGKGLEQYRTNIVHSTLLIEKKYGKYYSGESHHNVDAYRKTDYRIAVEKEFREQVKATIAHHTRSFGDLHRSIFSYYALVVKHAHLQYVSRKVSRKIDLNKPDYEKYFSHEYPKLFCMNDTQFATDADRIRAKAFLKDLFPTKSAFEK